MPFRLRWRYDPSPTMRVRHEPPENVLVFPCRSTSLAYLALSRGRIPAALSFQSVTHRYGTRIALDRLDLDVPQGEVLALLGPNGAGKSTTISALLGLVRPQEGRVEVLGCDPRQAVSAGRVGAMLQSGSGIGLPPGVRVDEALAVWSGGSTAGQHRVTRSSSERTSVLATARGEPTASRAARPSGSVSPLRSQAIPMSCSSTSPLPQWTWSPARDSGE